jgi:hypothetical protein
MVKTALFEARKCPNLNCISIMMSFLTYITGFFMNWIQDGADGDNFERGPPKDPFSNVWLRLAQ